LELILNISIF